MEAPERQARVPGVGPRAGRRRGATAAASACRPSAHAFGDAGQVHDQAAPPRARHARARARPAASSASPRPQLLGDARGLALDHVAGRLGRHVARGETRAAGRDDEPRRGGGLADRRGDRGRARPAPRAARPPRSRPRASSRQASAPETSSRSPRAAESLTVITVARGARLRYRSHALTAAERSTYSGIDSARHAPSDAPRCSSLLSCPAARQAAAAGRDARDLTVTVTDAKGQPIDRPAADRRRAARRTAWPRVASLRARRPAAHAGRTGRHQRGPGRRLPAERGRCRRRASCAAALGDALRALDDRGPPDQGRGLRPKTAQRHDGAARGPPAGRQHAARRAGGGSRDLGKARRARAPRSSRDRLGPEFSYRDRSAAADEAAGRGALFLPCSSTVEASTPGRRQRAVRLNYDYVLATLARRAAGLRENVLSSMALEQALRKRRARPRRRATGCATPRGPS